MSDLAPFVAAAIRDKSVEELQKENDRLQKENERLREMLSVQITGPEGTPVYSHAQLATDGFLQDYDDWEGWVVNFREEDLLPCVAEDLNAIEIRVGGVVILTGASLVDHRYGRVFEEERFDKESGYFEFDIYNLGSEGQGLCTELNLAIGPYESVSDYEKQVMKVGIPHPYTDLPSCRDLERVCNVIFFRSLEMEYEKVKLQVRSCERQQQGKSCS